MEVNENANNFEEPVKTEEAPPKKVIKKKKKSKKKSSKKPIDLTTSEGARSQKTLGPALRAGYFLSEIFGVGGEAVFNLSPKVQFGLLTMVGVTDLKSGGSFKENNVLTLQTYEASGDLYALQGRYYFTDTFNLVCGVGYRKIKINIVMISNSTETSYNQQIDVSNITGNVAIGNIWTWPSGFFIGADWIGLVMPLSKSYSVKTDSSGSTDTQEIHDAMQDIGIQYGEDLGGKSLYQLVNLSVGFLF